MLDTSAAEPASNGVPDLNPDRGYYQNYVDMTWFWLDRCRTSQAPLVEKMVLFWHGHLCSAVGKVIDRSAMFDQNQLFRTHGLGNLADLVNRAAVQPAMITYLDNDRNVAGSPNENFARELMELFTLGVGHYSEQDVQASARAWTGHGLNSDDHYQFNPHAHDWGEKTFFGVTKNWDGPMIIDHIIGGPKKQDVARFIGAKLWSFLAYPNPEPAVVEQVATEFVGSGMEIRSLVRAILMHPEFRSQRAMSGLMRTPIEYVVAAMQATNLACSDAHPEWNLRQMGQEPFNPPNVAGWKPNEYWITPTSVWAKGRFAGYVRWRLYNRDELADSADKSPPDAAEAALALFGIENASAATKNALIQYVNNERQSNQWAERVGLLMLPMMSPEFQLA